MISILLRINAIFALVGFHVIRQVSQSPGRTIPVLLSVLTDSFAVLACMRHCGYDARRRDAPR